MYHQKQWQAGTYTEGQVCESKHSLHSSHSHSQPHSPLPVETHHFSSVVISRLMIRRLDELCGCDKICKFPSGIFERNFYLMKLNQFKSYMICS